MTSATQYKVYSTFNYRKQHCEFFNQFITKQAITCSIAFIRRVYGRLVVSVGFERGDTGLQHQTYTDVVRFVKLKNLPNRKYLFSISLMKTKLI